MPADYRSLNVENPTKSSGVTASHSDPDFYKFCRVCPNSKWRTKAWSGLLFMTSWWWFVVLSVLFSVYRASEHSQIFWEDWVTPHTFKWSTRVEVTLGKYFLFLFRQWSWLLVQTNEIRRLKLNKSHKYFFYVDCVFHCFGNVLSMSWRFCVVVVVIHRRSGDSRTFGWLRLIKDQFTRSMIFVLKINVTDEKQ